MGPRRRLGFGLNSGASNLNLTQPVHVTKVFQLGKLPCVGSDDGETKGELAQVEAVLGAMDVLPLEEPADGVYGALRARLEQKEQVVGGNDLLIAAQARGGSSGCRRGACSTWSGLPTW